MDFNCRYRIGLSATIHLDNDRENERGVIWLKACCGDIKYEVSTSFLIEQGYLMQQNVELIKCEEPEGYEDWKWCQELRDELIYENAWRNRKVVAKTQEKINQGLKVLIVSNRHNQLEALREMLVDHDVPHAIVIGDDRMDERKAKVQAFLDGEIDVLLGTVFGEGIDIPEIECVINAEGGRDVKAAIQRMRNMTPAEGKAKAVFVDFMDMTNPYFAKHSAERLATYRSEHAFMIRIVD
jgi:superfamily II DNA or RNA helicase